MKKAKLFHKKKKTPMSDYLKEKYGDMSRFEPGIYNYCDRWCERCNESDKCILYYDEQQARSRYLSEGKGPDSLESAFEMVKEIFEETRKMIEMSAQEKGLDLDLNNLPETEDDEEDFWRQASKLLPVQKVRQFSQKAHEYVEEIEQEMRKYPFLIDKLEEDYQIFIHYYLLLNPKMRRALSSRLEYEQRKGDFKDWAKQDLGKTSQLVFKCIKKCHQSLKNFLDLKKEDVDEIMELLIWLKEVEQGFRKEVTLPSTF